MVAEFYLQICGFCQNLGELYIHYQVHDWHFKNFMSRHVYLYMHLTVPYVLQII